MAKPNTDRVLNLVRSYGTHRINGGEVGVTGPYQYLVFRYKGKDMKTYPTVLSIGSEWVVNPYINWGKNWIVNSAYAVVRKKQNVTTPGQVGAQFHNEENTAMSILSANIPASAPPGSIYYVPTATINSFNSWVPTAPGDEWLVSPYLDKGFPPNAFTDGVDDVMFVVEILDKTS